MGYPKWPPETFDHVWARSIGMFGISFKISPFFSLEEIAPIETLKCK